MRKLVLAVVARPMTNITSAVRCLSPPWPTAGTNLESRSPIKKEHSMKKRTGLLANFIPATIVLLAAVATMLLA